MIRKIKKLGKFSLPLDGCDFLNQWMINKFWSAVKSLFRCKLEFYAHKPISQHSADIF